MVVFSLTVSFLGYKMWVCLFANGTSVLGSMVAIS